MEKPQIHQLFAKNSLRNFNYILELSSSAVLIDPYDANQVATKLDHIKKPVLAIINTHEHHDHIRGNAELASKYGAAIWAHQNAQGKIPNVTRFFSGGEKVELENSWSLEILNTPGHTHAHLCLLLNFNDKTQAIFTGDTLFNAGVGNCHNGGDPEVLFETIRDHFMTLDDDVVVYPGHDYMRTNLGFTLAYEPKNKDASDWYLRHQKIDHDQEFWLTSIGIEKKINTFLRLGSSDLRDNLPSLTHSDKDVFLTLRQLRNHW